MYTQGVLTSLKAAFRRIQEQKTNSKVVESYCEQVTAILSLKISLQMEDTNRFAARAMSKQGSSKLPSSNLDFPPRSIFPGTLEPI